MLLHDRINGFQRPGLMLLVPKGLLPDNVELSPKVKAKPDALSDEWRFYDRSYPLLGWAKISLRLKKKVADPSKLYIVSHYGVDRNMGGEFKDGWVTGRMRELGADYEIAYDDIPPVLTSFNASARRLRVLAYDRQSGLRSLKGYVDGRFVLFEYMEKAGVYVCDLPSAPVAKTGGNHTVKLVAVDERGNRSVFGGDFKY